MTMKRFILFILLSGATAAQAQSFSNASTQVEQDLQASLTELAGVRNEIAKEQITLTRAVNKLEAEVLQKSREVERLQRQADNRAVGLSGLKSEVDSRKDEIDYISGLLNDFVRNFETKVHISETQLYENAIREAKLSIEDVNLSQPEKFALQMAVVDTAVSRLDDLIGGQIYEGKALNNKSGMLEPGSFAAIGPVVFYKNAEGSTVGITQRQGNGLNAVVIELAEKHLPGIIELIDSGTGIIPADPTMGKALKMAQTRESLQEHIGKGGLWGMVILILGAIGLILAIFKAIDIASVKVPNVDTIEGMLYDIDADKVEDARAKADSIPGAPGKIYQDAVKHINQRRSVLEEIIFARLLEIRPKLERFLAFIALVAAASPLLGLLGTVTGMIKTFDLITIFGTGDAKSLSGGISEALVTTELGLAVAIPALLLHGLLNRMARRKIADLEQGAVSFLNALEVKQNAS